MIKAVIFDLDGVLVESKDWHYTALNSALLSIDPKYVISYDEHLCIYDGLTTTRKLELLSINKGLEKRYFDKKYINSKNFLIAQLKTRQIYY